MSKRTVEFEFDVTNKVITPFTDKGIITMLGYEKDDNINYYVENGVQGVSNKWFKASDLKLA